MAKNNETIELANATIDFVSKVVDYGVIDHNSKKEDLFQIKKQLDSSKLENSVINLNINEFLDSIKKIKVHHHAHF